jgi:hypothetical protein
MIRIVDLFKKPDTDGRQQSRPEPVAEPAPPPPAPLPQPKPAPQRLTGQGLNELLDNLIAGLKYIAAAQTPPAEAAKRVEALLADLDALADQLILRDPGFLPALDRRPDEPVYSRALKKAVRSVNIALDANYTPDQLKEIALAALLSGLEAGRSGGEFNRLSGLIGRRVKLDEEACRNILNLAEIYENLAHSGN